MANDEKDPVQPNTLGNTSLVLGIIGSTVVFCIGLCSGVGHQQGWLKNVAALLFVAGGTFTFMGALSVLLGLGGLFGRNRSKATAVIGLVLGIITILIFAAIINAVQK